MPGLAPAIHVFRFAGNWWMPAFAGMTAKAVTLLAGGNRDLGLRSPFPLALQPLGHDEGQLERLVGVEPRIAMGVVAVRQIGLGDGLGAAHAFGPVLAGPLDMDAAGMGPFGAVDVEEG